MGIKGSLYIALSIAIAGLMGSCKSGGNDPGLEYMPDMKHAISYQANYYDYYWYNRWGGEDVYHDFALPRTPVEGTMPRGYIGIAYADNYEEKFMEKKAMQGMPMNGHVPFYYEDTNEDRITAEQEIRKNPFPITEEGLKIGGELYQIYCGICHGSGGEGDGYLVRDNGGKYPAMPADFMLDKFIDTTAGVYYYTIMYGKNMMGSYADKLSYKERWEVIHFIRSLQADKRGLEYSPTANTLNDEAIPYSEVADKIANAKQAFKEDGMYGFTEGEAHKEANAPAAEGEGAKSGK